MNEKYKFISGEEPTDQQIQQLMDDVLIDVKKRSEIASRKFRFLQEKQITEAKERFKNHNYLNG